MGTRIKPGKSSGKGLHAQSSFFQKLLVNGGDFKLSAGRGLNVSCHIYHVVWIKVESYNSIVGLGMLWFFFNGKTDAIGIEFCNTIAFWISYPVTEYRSLVVLFCGAYSFTEHIGKAIAVKNVVAQHQTDRVVPDELFADDKGLSQTIREWLFRIPE